MRRGWLVACVSVVLVSASVSVAHGVTIGDGAGTTGFPALSVRGSGIVTVETSQTVNLTRDANNMPSIVFPIAHGASAGLAAFSVEPTTPVVLAVESLQVLRGMVNPSQAGDGYGHALWVGSTWMMSNATWGSVMKSKVNITGSNGDVRYGDKIVPEQLGYAESASGSTTCTPSWQWRGGAYSGAIAVLVPNGSGSWDVYAYTAAGVSGMLNWASIRSAYARGVSWASLKSGGNAIVLWTSTSPNWSTGAYSANPAAVNKHWDRVRTAYVAEAVPFATAYALLSSLSDWQASAVTAYIQDAASAYQPEGVDEGEPGGDVGDVTDSGDWWDWGSGWFDGLRGFMPWLEYVQKLEREGY